MSIDKIPEYKNKNEIQKEGQPRPDDFTYNGQKNSETLKTEGQERVLNLSKRVILERMNKLGVSPQNNFDIQRVNYEIPTDFNMYSMRDIILLRKSTEANVGTNIHEMLHAYSAQYRNNDFSEVDEYAINNKKSVKSGFHTNHYHDGFEEKYTSINFKQINEAITEKISRELVDDNFEEIKQLKPLFEGRKDKLLDKYEKNFKKNNNKAAEKEIIQVEKRFTENVDKYTKQLEEDLLSINKDVLISEKEKNKRIDKHKKMYESFIEYLEKEKERGIEFAKLYEKMDNLQKEQLNIIKKDYSFEKERDSYQGFIEILDELIEGVAILNFERSEDFEKNKEKAWEEIQKAYFTGNTMYLRIFDKSYKDDILRQINNLNMWNFKDIEDFRKKITLKNKELLKSRLN